MKNSIVIPEAPIDKGTLAFTIEGRILRELGERLVKQPDVAILELVKNSYDADALECTVNYSAPEFISVTDNGTGMTLEEFTSGWMRIGTSSKEETRNSHRYGREITGEKGIGRFAVRFLGKYLELETVAFDKNRNFKTRLIATFDWPAFDHHEDLGNVMVPYLLTKANPNEKVGTTLRIEKLRQGASGINLHAVRTAAIGVVTPYHSLLKQFPIAKRPGPVARREYEQDSGFTLKILPADDETDGGDLAKIVLDNFVIRSVVHLSENRLQLKVYRGGDTSPVLDIDDKYENSVGSINADIRFYPRRKGTYTDLPLDGRKAMSWVKQHSGVAVFDRTFRVHPYGNEGDDWLLLSADTARRTRESRSSLANKYFPMDLMTRQSTRLNYMLRLPYPQQLVGVVQVVGRRTQDKSDDEAGLIAAADREGFIGNLAFTQLQDVIRGAVEAIAAMDREWQQELDVIEHDSLLGRLKEETRQAIEEIHANPNITAPEKLRIVQQLSQTQNLAVHHQQVSREREAGLEVMSLLGVVAGFMTHEFGVAIHELEQAFEKISVLAKKHAELRESSISISSHIASLKEFVTYSQGYVQGASSRPSRPYLVRPRIQQAIRVFGKYAAERKIEISVEIDPELAAPMVPVSLYNGVALNLFTNALKAVTAKSGPGQKNITFKAWNDDSWHILEVSDTGVGIPASLRERVFDPLFTTTASNRDPLGSGMGLGLTLVKRGVESHGGKIQVVEPPLGFSTCVRLRLPL